MERARREYLAFVDGDDVLPANAYELLLHALEAVRIRNFVSGAVDEWARRESPRRGHSARWR